MITNTHRSPPIVGKQTHTHERDRRSRLDDDYTKTYLNSPVGVVVFVILKRNSARSTVEKKSLAKSEEKNLSLAAYRNRGSYKYLWCAGANWFAEKFYNHEFRADECRARFSETFTDRKLIFRFAFKCSAK